LHDDQVNYIPIRKIKKVFQFSEFLNTIQKGICENSIGQSLLHVCINFAFICFFNGEFADYFDFIEVVCVVNLEAKEISFDARHATTI